MKFRVFLTITANLSLIILLSACGTTDYYKDRAVQRARVFLLQEDRILNLEQREYVKFNKPVIMATPIFYKIGTNSATSGTLSHVCIAWVVPGRKDAHIVFGASDNRLRDWTPNRVLVKRYDKPARHYHKAKRTAILFGVNNFLYLTTQQLNRIRFEVPETIITDYEVSDKKLKGRHFSRAQLKSLVQITFVWASNSPDNKIFICGFGAKNLKGWRPVFGGETPVSKLRKHFLGTVSFGQFAPKPEEDKKVPKAKIVDKVKEIPMVKETPKVKEKVKVVPKAKETVKVKAAPKVKEVKNKF